jgi:hypothetical protein
MPDISVSDLGYSIVPPAGKALVLNNLQIKKIVQTVDHAQFTDGGAAVGTFSLGEVIPVGALYLGTAVTKVTGFAGDTSAVLTIGDGTDVDRYNTGTINVFATAANGIASGVPSGALYHAAQITPKLTITTAADWTSVSAGEVTVELYYLT